MILDNFLKMSEIKPSDKLVMEKNKNVNLLSLNYCGLRTLNNLPVFPNLEIVWIHLFAVGTICNRFNGDELVKIPYNNFYKIKLSNNNISKIDKLKSFINIKINLYKS